jgi:hypothetical protein
MARPGGSNGLPLARLRRVAVAGQGSGPGIRLGTVTESGLGRRGQRDLKFAGLVTWPRT